MNKKELKKIKLGLYKLFWRSGGYSFASVGQDKSGSLWFAPCNWVNVPCFNWRNVLRIEGICLTQYAADFSPVMGTAEFIETKEKASIEK